MYNTEFPTRAQLPTSGRLLRSTFIAFVSAVVLLITIVLPAEYAVDLTGIGRVLGLTEMGEIKSQLSREAEADAPGATVTTSQTLSTSDPEVSTETVSETALATSDKSVARITSLEQEAETPQPEAEVVTAPADPVIETASRLDAAAVTPRSNVELEARLSSIDRQLDQLEETATPTQPALEPLDTPEEETETSNIPTPRPAPAPAALQWRDEISLVLQPAEGVEFKLVMEAGQVAEFSWTANGSVLNFDTHGDGDDQTITYEKGRGVPGQDGKLTAAFAGDHGWFWRNRTDAPVTLILRTRGQYSQLKRTV